MNGTKLDTTIIAEDYVPAQNDLVLTRIIEVERNRHGVDMVYRFRTRIKRNSHDFQSLAVCEYWNGLEWTDVASFHGEHPLMKELPSYVSRDHGANTVALRNVAELLEKRAIKVVT